MSDSVKNTPSQSIEIVDPEGSYNKDNTDEVNQLSRYQYFYNIYFEFYNAKSKNQLVDLIASYEAMKAVRGGSQ